jgi:tetratricopeptide (TPR) repeat protein
VLTTLVAHLPASATRRLSLLERAMQEDPRSVRVHELLAETLLRDISSPTPVHCAGEKLPRCVQAIRSHARFLEAEQPNSFAGLEYAARLELWQGHPERVEALLANRCNQYKNARSCWTLWIGAIAKSGDMARLEHAADSYRSVACAEAKACAEASSWLGDQFARLERWGLAAAYYAKALEVDSNPELWIRFARATWLAGEPNRALVALERASRIAHSPQTKASIQRLRSQISASALKSGPPRQKPP